MKTRFMAVSLLIASLGICSPTIAASIDFIDNVGYTTDKISGIDWLDVSTTNGLSYGTVAGYITAGSTVNGQNYSGWRYATTSEYRAMISNFFGISLTNFAQVNAREALQFLRLFGSNESETHPFYFYLGVNGRLIDESGTPSNPLANVSFYDYYLGTTQGELSVSHGFPDYFNSSHSAGSFLVKGGPALIATPIPAALFMFAPALLGFFGLRRKFQA